MNRSFWPTSTDAPSPSRTMPCSSVTRITVASRSTHSEIPGGVAAPSTTPRSPLNVFDPASTVVHPARRVLITVARIERATSSGRADPAATCIAS
jgi:hypothetical protein